MKRKAALIFTVGIGVAAVLGLLSGLALARGEMLVPAADTAPTVISYQGEVQVDGATYDGTGYFKFAVVNTAGSQTFWSNDGSSSNGSEPSDAVPLMVQDGIFSVLLGNPLETNMTQPIAATVFANRSRRLHVWFSQTEGGPYTDMGSSDIVAVPYALNTETLDGLDGNYYDQHYEHVVVVAKSGGDYSTINEALDSIADNGEYSRYLVWVAPGIYTETVTMKPYVAIQGAGAGVSVISSLAATNYPPMEATVVVTENVTLRDVSVVVTGTGNYKAAILVQDVEADTVEISDVLAQASGGSYGYGIFNANAAPLIRDAVLKGEGMNDGFGIFNYYSSPTIQNVTANGKGGNDYSADDGYGIYEYYSSSIIQDSTANGEGEYNAFGIFCNHSSPVIQNVTASGESAGEGYGIYNSSSSTTIRRSVASGEGGSASYGIVNYAPSGAYTVTVDGCQVMGNSLSIANDSHFTMQVGVSLLDGSVNSIGIYQCVGTYDENYQSLSSDCGP